MLMSFVVPVYNVEKYLNECLDSIFDPAVDEDEYEVIAVDDGSTDSSPEILKTYTHHKNFRIITQENGGLSDARNTGIEAATGKYIYFVDSDDFLLPRAVPVLLDLARESDCDIIDFDYRMTDDKGNALPEIKSQMNRTPNAGRGKDLLVEWYKREVFFEVVWIRLYNRHFIINNALLFIRGIINEDVDWQFRCFFLAETVVYHPVVIYNYRRRVGSLSLGTDNLARLHNALKILDLLVSFRNTIDVDEDNAKYLALLGDYISVFLERMINDFYKLTGSRHQKELVFIELKKRRALLSLAAGKKGKRMYKITCCLPAILAFRMYKIF